MRVFSIETLIVILLAFVTCSCGSHKVAPEPFIPDPVVSDPVVPELSLRVLAETYVDDGTATNVAYTVLPTETGHTVEVTVEGALNLKAMFFELDYDAALYYPVNCTATSLLDPLATPIEISFLDVPGTVSHSQVVQKYDQHSGFTGNGVLTRIEFATGAAPENHEASTLGTPHASGPIVFVDYYNRFLRVYHNINGDYDQNGEVNLADIMPLSLFYGNRLVGDRVGFWGPHTDGSFVDRDDTDPVFYVDGNKDGEIDMADLSTITEQYGNTLTGFDICASQDYLGDYPFSGLMTDSSAVVGTFSLPASTGYDPENRVFWEYSLPSLDYENHYWVHPVSGDDNGSASMLAVDLGDYPASIDKELGLVYDAGAGVLSWSSNLRGDLDSDVQVSYSDLTVIAINFGLQGPFQQDSIQWAVDGNRDGIINMADMFIVGLLFGNEEDYQIFATLYADLVPETAIDSERLQPLDLVLNHDREDFSVRSTYSTEVAFEPGTYVWLRMVSDEGNVGPRSEVIQIP